MGEPLLLQLFVASTVPVVKILLICTIGAFCARKGLLTPEGRRVLGSLSFLVFNPALIFVKLASTLTPGRLLHWWPLVLNTGISTAVGLGLGYLAVRLVQPPHPLRPHTIVAIALGNLGNLPLVIVSSLASSSAELLHGISPDRAEDLAVSYVVVGLLVPVIAHATIGFSMLRKCNAMELQEAEEAEDAAAAAAGAGAGCDVDDSAMALQTVVPTDTVKARDATEEAHCLPAMDGAAAVRSLELQKRPLLEDQNRKADGSSASSSWCDAACGLCGSRWADGAAAAAAAAGVDTRAVLRTSASGAVGLRRSASGSISAGGDSHASKHHQPLRRPRRSSSDSAGPQMPAVAPVGQMYGYTMGALEQAPSDVLLQPLPSSEEHQDLLQDERSRLLAATGGPLSQELELGRVPVVAPGLEHRGKPHPTGAAVTVEIPSLAGPRVVSVHHHDSCAETLRSSSARRALGRFLAPSISGRRVAFLEWPSRVEWRALGRQVLREAVSPPLLAILLSVPVGCIAPLQRAFFDSGSSSGSSGKAPLGLLTACLSMLGDCTIPSILLILGATLGNGPGAARVPLRVIGLVNTTRLALLPLLGLALVMGAYAARVFEAPDPIYLLVLLIQNTAPTAIMVHTMASVHGNGAEEVSSILFWGYITGIAIIPLWLTLFLYVVKLQFRYGGKGAPAA